MAIVKSKESSRAAPPKAVGKFFGVTSQPPLTLDEHLHRIQAIGKRIDSYVQFMCQLVAQPGFSAEAKERAIQAFYTQIIVVEKQLGKIHDELRLE